MAYLEKRGLFSYQGCLLKKTGWLVGVWTDGRTGRHFNLQTQMLGEIFMKRLPTK